MTRSLDDFDASATGVSGTLWGLPFDVESATLVVLPVPWEVTVSYGGGASSGPRAILEASTQVDLYDSDHPDAWKKGIAMAPIPEDLERQGEILRTEAAKAIEAVHAGGAEDPETLRRINEEAAGLLERGKLVAVLGGDHSAPLGLMQALAERAGTYGILHIDAHSDLREGYEGFVHSHASIMHNALRIEAVSRLVQVGIRDYSGEEVEAIRSSSGRVKLFDYRGLERRRFAGLSWASLVKEIVDELPEKVYVSFDIDGLDPALCPGTGTPVPGGLQFEEALYLVERVRASGRRIIGFDLCEVSPGRGAEGAGEWDANVGARVLYRLCCTALA
ncbi:MAG: agmatinase family protein [Vicinamibacteria bacterium]